MLRRTFLAAAAASSALAEEAPGIGFLGIGHVHGEAKLNIVRQSPAWRLIGVAESDPALRARVERLGVPLIDREELLRNPQVQVVVVESLVRDHARDAKAALSAGKHVHLEKAPAAKLKDFEEIVSLARTKNLLLQTGYMWRYHPGISKALEAARAGWLGQVYLLRASISNQQVPNLRADIAEFPGGLMFELAGHLIDPIVRLMGRPRKVTPFLRHDGPFADALKDNTLAVFEFDRALAIVHGAAINPVSGRYRALEIQGTNGCAIVNPIEPPALTIDLDKPAGPYARGPQKVNTGAYQRYVEDFADLAAAVRGEGKLRVTLDEELLVQEALLRASGME